jgi:glycosyltransferase involved in cell wall biosynthesis
MPSKFVTDNWAIRAHLASQDTDAVFSLGDTSLIACKRPHLLLVQQAYLAYRPEDWGFEPRRGFRAKMALMAAYFRAGLPSVSRFTVQTSSMKTRLCERWQLEPERVCVVPSAIDIEPSTRWSTTAGSPRPYLAYIASASPHKNFKILASMMRALPSSLDDLVCKISVRAEEVPELVEAARRFGVLNRIEFLGAVKDIGALIAGAEAFVMPSKLESFGLPYYEAMAIGCPLIVAERDFAREACGEAACFADPDSGEDFAQQVARVLESRHTQQEFSRRGLARYKDVQISWDEIARKYRRIISEIVGASPPAN